MNWKLCGDGGETAFFLFLVLPFLDDIANFQAVQHGLRPEARRVSRNMHLLTIGYADRGKLVPDETSQELLSLKI